MSKTERSEATIHMKCDTAGALRDRLSPEIQARKSQQRRWATPHHMCDVYFKGLRIRTHKENPHTMRQGLQAYSQSSY